MTTYSVIHQTEINDSYPDLADMVGGHADWLLIQTGPDCSEIIDSYESEQEARKLAAKYSAQEPTE